MNLIVIGVNHQTAPVEVREQFAIPEARLPQAVKTLAAQPGIVDRNIDTAELLHRRVDHCRDRLRL